MTGGRGEGSYTNTSKTKAYHEKSRVSALIVTKKGLLLLTSDGSGTRNLGFGFWKCHGEMDLKGAN